MTRPVPESPGPGESHVIGAATDGERGCLVDVRARIAGDPARFTVTGLGDNLAYPLRDRVRAAVLNSGFTWPAQAITVELEPPGLQCVGIDLAVAIAVLTAAGTIPAGSASSCVLIADLGLDGSVRAVHGLQPAATAAVRAGLAIAIVAPGDAAEVAGTSSMSVVTASSLRAIVAWLRRRP